MAEQAEPRTSDREDTVMSQNDNAPKPANVLYDESGSASTWLDSAWSFEEIRDEWEWLFEDGDKPLAEYFTEIWVRPRWTTQAERDDPDQLYDLFGETWEEMVDTTVAYDQAKPGAEGAYKYWTVD